MSEKNNIFNLHNAKYAFSVIAVIFVILAAYKIFNEIFNSSIMKSLASVAGSAAYGFNALVDGCKAQTNCDNIKNNQDDCKKNEDCTYDSVSGICAIAGDRKAGEGGFTSTSCALGMGLITYGVASLFLTIITGFATVFGVYKTSNAVKQSEILGVGTEGEILKNLKNEAEKLKKDVEMKKKEGLELTKKEELLVISSSLNEKLEKKNIEKINSTADAKERNIELVKNAEIFRQNKEKIFEKSSTEEKRRVEDFKKELPKRAI